MLNGEANLQIPAGDFLVPSSPAANEGIKKSQWEKKKNGNIFLDVLAVLREERSVWRWGDYLAEKTGGGVPPDISHSDFGARLVQ